MIPDPARYCPRMSSAFRDFSDALSPQTVERPVKLRELLDRSIALRAVCDGAPDWKTRVDRS